MVCLSAVLWMSFNLPRIFFSDVLMSSACFIVGLKAEFAFHGLIILFWLVRYSKLVSPSICLLFLTLEILNTPGCFLEIVSLGTLGS